MPKLLDLKWAICDKFRNWIKGHKFTLWSDNNLLTYILNKSKLDACEQRWVTDLAPYIFDIRHISGCVNVVAELSEGNVYRKLEYHTTVLTPDAVSSVLFHSFSMAEGTECGLAVRIVL